MSPRSAADCSYSAENSSESGDGYNCFAEAPAADILEGSLPMGLPRTAALTTPHLSTANVSNVAASFAPQMPSGFSLPLQNMPAHANGRGCSPHLLLLLQKALVERQLPPGVAALLVQTLQHQISGRQVPDVSQTPTTPGTGSGAGPSFQPLTFPPLEQFLSPSSSLLAQRQSSSGSSSPASGAATEGVDGLLLLSACADAQRPASPQPVQPAALEMSSSAIAASSMSLHPNSKMMHSMLSGSIASLMTPTMAIA